MSILALPRQHLKHHPSEGAIPVARRPRRADDTVPNLAAYRTPAAPHLAVSDRDRELHFDDVAAPAAAPPRPVRRELRPDAGRMVLGFLAAAELHFTPDVLTHDLGLRSVPLAPVDDIDTVTADIRTTLAAHPEHAGNLALLMVLGPLATMLDAPDPATDWADTLHGVEAATLRKLSRLDANTYQTLNGWQDLMQPVIDVHRALLDDVDMVPLDAVRVREVLAADAEQLAQVA